MRVAKKPNFKVATTTDDGNHGTDIDKIDLNCGCFNIHKLNVRRASRLESLTLIDSISSTKLSKKNTETTTKEEGEGKQEDEKKKEEKKKKEDEKKKEEEKKKEDDDARERAEQRYQGIKLEYLMDEDNANGCGIL